MIKKIALTICAITLASGAMAQDKVKMQTRVIPVQSMIGERIESVGTASGIEGSQSENWIEFFTELGVPWPEGSSIRLDRVSGKLIVVNTPENLDLFAQVMDSLGCIPFQVEIEAYFVQYDLADISTLAAKRKLTAEELKALWQAGKGELLFAPRVVTQSGMEATVKGVTEVIYPTEMAAEVTASNQVERTTELGGFETRETGVILTVLPEVSPEGSLINLTMQPEVVLDPEWRTYEEIVKSGKEERRRTLIELPFFYTYTARSSVQIGNGEMLLIAGGIPARQEGKIIYVFVTAQRVDVQGNALRTKAAISP